MAFCQNPASGRQRVISNQDTFSSLSTQKVSVFWSHVKEMPVCLRNCIGKKRGFYTIVSGNILYFSYFFDICPMFVSTIGKNLKQLFQFIFVCPFFLSFFQMLTLSISPEFNDWEFRNKHFRSLRLAQLRDMKNEGIYNSVPLKYWDDELRQKKKSDIVKLQLLELLSPTMLKKVVGVRDRVTGDVKFVDQTVIQTFDKKLNLNPDILAKGDAFQRKKFESRVIKELDDSTILCNDVNRIIAKFAIMD